MREIGKKDKEKDQARKWLISEMDSIAYKNEGTNYLKPDAQFDMDLSASLTIRYANPKFRHISQYHKRQNTTTSTYCRHPSVEEDMFHCRLAVWLKRNGPRDSRHDSKCQQQNIDPRWCCRGTLFLLSIFSIYV